MEATSKIFQPKTIFSRRPMDFRSAAKVEENCSRGIGDDYKLSTKDSSISLTSWIQLVRIHMEDHGMDSVFRRIDSRGKEVYMLQEWGETEKQEVVEHVKQLKKGTYNEPPCSFDIDNLRWSGKAIVASIGQDMWRTVEKEILTDDGVSGPHAFQIIIGHLQQTNSSSVRQLVTKLEKMVLKDESGQNVITFGDKVMEVARRIEGTGMAPRDLSAICASRFLQSDLTRQSDSYLSQ